MRVPSELRYTKTHEWILPDENEAMVGITVHAQEELRDVVYVELPAVGKSVKQGEPAAVVESVKAAFDIYAPISGTVVKVNSALASSPQLVNKDCYGEGWFFAIKPSEPQELNALMTSDQYTELTASETH
ncbi:MAG: glycine cleavage system protein GcvH [Candidatus Omnitrophica bacterium]|nr:glycine cleavage system protein GcvH [Candidatus Omnitrophota bacterium]